MKVCAFFDHDFFFSQLESQELQEDSSLLKTLSSLVFIKIIDSTQESEHKKKKKTNGIVVLDFYDDGVLDRLLTSDGKRPLDKRPNDTGEERHRVSTFRSENERKGKRRTLRERESETVRPGAENRNVRFALGVVG